jgi:hypothetical protein
MAGLQNTRRGLPTLEEARAIVSQYASTAANNTQDAGTKAKGWITAPRQNLDRVMGEINAMTPERRAGLAEASANYLGGFGGTVRNWARDPAITRNASYQISKTGVKPMAGMNANAIDARIKPFLGSDGLLSPQASVREVEALIGRIPQQYRKWRYADEFQPIGK